MESKATESGTVGMEAPHLRIARPVTNLARSAEAYRRGLRLHELGRFEDHGGFDGIMLGAPGAAERGRTFADPDGYRFVLENAAWRAS